MRKARPASTPHRTGRSVDELGRPRKMRATLPVGPEGGHGNRRCRAAAGDPGYLGAPRPCNRRAYPLTGADVVAKHARGDD